jgi:hypothetical protein
VAGPGRAGPGRAGLVAGDAEASTVPAIDMSSIGTNSFVRRRSEASMPIRATSSREGRRGEAGGEGFACASVAGWGRAGGCGSAPPRPGWFPAPATLRRASCCHWAAGAPFRELMRDELRDCCAYRIPPLPPAPRFARASLPTASGGVPLLPRSIPGLTCWLLAWT